MNEVAINKGAKMTFNVERNTEDDIFEDAVENVIKPNNCNGNAQSNVDLRIQLLDTEKLLGLALNNKFSLAIELCNEK